MRFRWSCTRTGRAAAAGQWVADVAANGFAVTRQDVADVPQIKTRYGAPAALQSCQTAVVGDDTIQGHVPANLIANVLRGRPTIAGFTAPGMVPGSPGNETGDRHHAYDVVSFTCDDAAAAYASRRCHTPSFALFTSPSSRPHVT